ncbi:uncharacterized protein PGTG_13356 [Puccinia graminis f. sp. tritici CRL 75-36-700-3]|uniref:Uncharacterized protein n=1 Tax=Puccinia graminis f. sp. tritici (strain CRL 75-36-700-3 / race SCCL) TaxID=418459 RepID=E3KS62_PUCGT|nr:uncharacterized protein PGTG_13356 [Puccinia graminis f. sp. tritici CRL 75-36-700-3]EFP87137.1 hypothetical protein PGTG_13356 [Puccinia graminis f. sp. tritici CRL 75-36-700-3]
MSFGRKKWTTTTVMLQESEQTVATGDESWVQGHRPQTPGVKQCLVLKAAIRRAKRRYVQNPVRKASEELP